MFSFQFFRTPLFSLFLLTISGHCFSHEGHEIQDVVIRDLKDLGKVNFDISCQSGIQNDVNVGVALLHHMMYAQAETHFTRLIEKAPNCAILYWGYSMSLFHPLWPDTISDKALEMGQRALAKAVKLPSSKREQDYIRAAMAYFDRWQSKPEALRIKDWFLAQQDLYNLYPDDIDANAFFALSQLVMAPKNDPKFHVEKLAGKRLNQIYTLNPTHPGAIHYSIHAYDNPVLARLGAKIADAYGQIAPDVPHALHMPSHIFVRLGEWGKAASWNIRSANAALNIPANGLTSLHYVHAADYLIYAYMQSGNKQKALDFIEEIELHHPIQATFPSAYALAAIPARVALESEDWVGAENLGIRQPDYIDWDKFPQIEAMTYFSRGLGAARNGNIDGAKKNLKVLAQLYHKTVKLSPDYWALLVNAQKWVVEAWINYAQGNVDKAIQLSYKAADLEGSVEKNPVTPGAVLPARELLADMLMLTGDFTGALAAYQTSLKVSPNRRKSLQGQIVTSTKLNRALTPSSN